MRISELLLLCVAVLAFSCKPQTKTTVSQVKQVKLADFYLQSSHVITQPGELLSTAEYKNDLYWFPVKVPSTVLSGLVANGVYPDPYTGMNNMLIPDANDEFNREYKLEQYSHLPGQPNPWKKPYWYRTEFSVPSEDNGRHFELIFKGINYRAGVWLNGKQVADSSQMAGMFAEYRLDVTDRIVPGGNNYLAVKIWPLDFPGLPSKEQLKGLDDFYPNGGPTGDIGKNVTMLCSVGWDWMPPVRDRNIGIWQPVYLRTSGAVKITRPRIVTTLPDQPENGPAKISLSLNLTNYSPADENGRLTVTISPETFAGESVTVERDIVLKGNSGTVAEFSPESGNAFVIEQPRLWWPVGYGDPDLYRMNIKFESGSGVSDEQSILFGIRTVSTSADQVNGVWRRYFYVNGRRIHITGGAWVPDMMLNRDSLRYDYELRLCRNSGINLVRIWGGGVTPSDLFFDAADRYGLLVWSDFWVTGDTQGEFKGSPDWPLSGEIFRKNIESTIYRIRNHPSLLVWTGGNEGHARKELYYAMRDSIIRLDGTRPFIPSSSGFAHLPEGWDASWPDGKPSGVYSGGPYTWQDPKDYYKRADASGDWVFKDETGIPSQPVYSSLPRIIPNLVWDKKLPFPLNDSWGYHDAATGNGRYDLYLNEMVKRYGQPVSMKEFSDKMQLMNAAGYQGIFEAAGHRLNDIGGVMLWKLNAAFPSVAWQVYDWFLAPNAGYYFMQNAVEPVHIQFNTLDLNVEYINRTYKKVSGLKGEIKVYDIKSVLLFSQTENIDLEGPSSKEGISLTDVLGKNQGVSFIILTLTDESGNTVSRNAYWHSASGDFTELNGMDRTSVEVDITDALSLENEDIWKVSVRNGTDRIAFFINPVMLSGKDEVLPSFWSANYFTLGPGESVDLQVGYPPEAVKGDDLRLKVEGWNVAEIVVPIR